MTVMYPIELNLHGRPVVVVGGGPVAARKTARLVEAGALVRVISPKFAPELADRDDVERIERGYEAADVRGARLVFACTDDSELNRRIALDARAESAWCNVADDGAESDFVLPAVLRRGRLSVAVGTGGASPALAAAVRNRLEKVLDPELAPLLEELDRARAIVKARIGDEAIRRRLFETLCAEDSLRVMAGHGREAWRAWLERLIAQHGLEAGETGRATGTASEQGADTNRGSS